MFLQFVRKQKNRRIKYSQLGINSMHNVRYPAMANYIVFYIVINLH